jgi:hypothetical protein
LTPERLEEIRRTAKDGGPGTWQCIHELLAHVDQLTADLGYARGSNSLLRDEIEIEKKKHRLQIDTAWASSASLRAEAASLRQGVERLAKRLGAFLEIAERSKEASDRTWARARKIQDPATMARNGQQEEAKRQLAMIDRAPVVSDFGNIAERLEAEIKPARAALRETEGLVTCKHGEVREAPPLSPPGMVECARCRTLVPNKGLGAP